MTPASRRPHHEVNEGEVMEEKHFAIEEIALCSSTPGGTPTSGGRPPHGPAGQSG